MQDVLVIGSSLGGWIGAEMALRDSAALISDLILIDAAGIEVDGDRIVTPAYSARYASAFPNARFRIIENAGHLPHIEQPNATLALIDEFVADQG